jgi:outer membrane protein TolC
VREQELLLRAEIGANLASVVTAYEAALIEESNQEVADEQLRLAREQYRLGLTSFIQLVEAETVKAQADQTRIAAIFFYHDALALLESLVGAPLRNQ